MSETNGNEDARPQTRSFLGALFPPPKSEGRRMLSVLLCVLFIGWLAYGDQIRTYFDARTASNLEWHTLSPLGWGFTVQMPGEAERTSSPIAIPGGPTTVTDTWMVNRNSLGVFTVSVTKLPFRAPGVTDAAILDGARGEVLAKDGATLVSETDITSPSGHLGRELRATVRWQGHTVKSIYRTYVVGDTIYQAATGYLTTPQLSEKYIQTFELEPQEAEKR